MEQTHIPWVPSLVGAVQTRDSDARCVSRWPQLMQTNTCTRVETCRASDTHWALRWSDLVCLLSRKHFFTNAPSPCSSALSVCWFRLPQACLYLACCSEKFDSEFTSLLENWPLLESCHWLLFLVVSQMTFYLTPPALPAYISLFLLWFISTLSKGSAALNLELIAATKFYLVVCLYTLETVQPPHSLMYVHGDWSETIFWFLFLCGALKDFDFTENEEHDGLLRTIALLAVQDCL